MFKYFVPQKCIFCYLLKIKMHTFCICFNSSLCENSLKSDLKNKNKFLMNQSEIQMNAEILSSKGHALNYNFMS